MILRLGLLAVAALAAIPLSPAHATFDHAQTIATEVALRRAQIRAAMCEQNVGAEQLRGRDASRVLRLPPYPPVGPGTPVRNPICPARLGTAAR